jgi:hypothetical protein
MSGQAQPAPGAMGSFFHQPSFSAVCSRDENVPAVDSRGYLSLAAWQIEIALSYRIDKIISFMKPLLACRKGTPLCPPCPQPQHQRSNKGPSLTVQCPQHVQHAPIRGCTRVTCLED